MRIGLLLMFGFLSLGAMAQEGQFLDFKELIKEEEGKGVGFVPDKYTVLPVDRWVYVTDKEGRQIIVSSNGRFAIAGEFKFVDLWRVEKITGHEAAEKASIIPMDRLDRGGKQIAGLLWGKPYSEQSEKPPVYVFTDPLCKTCQRFIEHLEKTNLYKEHTFKFVYFPAVKKESKDVIKAFHCGADSVKYEALKTGVVKGGRSGQCNFADMVAAVAVAEKIGIKRVPFVVNSQGEAQSFGDEEFKDIGKFLNAN